MAFFQLRTYLLLIWSLLFVPYARSNKHTKYYNSLYYIMCGTWYLFVDLQMCLPAPVVLLLILLHLPNQIKSNRTEQNRTTETNAHPSIRKSDQDIVIKGQLLSSGCNYSKITLSYHDMLCHIQPNASQHRATLKTATVYCI